MPARFSILLILVLLLAACSKPSSDDTSSSVDVVRIFITATISSTPTFTATPTSSQTAIPTFTPTQTPTPTPTAPAIAVVGNPRAYTLFDPLPQAGAPCGWVDTLDFPLDPPHGQNARGGGDFGTYRQRYEKYHAGEDWGLSNRSNFGQPVYSIGHGQVTYAQPLGWGADKGVVILRHNFPDGPSLLSFYGHLDPPSVTLREGDCVTRGQVIGRIGRPRTPPHLHFEIRLHMPYATGGGYWPSDPVNAGWLSPSQTINQYRLQVAPGVVWSKDLNADLLLGNLDSNILLMIEEENLLGIDNLTGEILWSRVLTEYVKDALLDRKNRLLYVLDTLEGLLAFSIPEMADERDLPEDLVPLWEQKLTSSGRMDLMPLPMGGVLVSYRDTLSAFSPQGDLYWEQSLDGYLDSWASSDQTLIFTTTDDEISLASADSNGLSIWNDGIAGIPLAAVDQAWLYAEDGLYRLDSADRAVKLVYDLPAALMRRSTAIVRSTGGLVLLHTDTADRRLLVFSADGTLLEEFSVPMVDIPQLFELNGSIFLVNYPRFSGQGSYKAVEIFNVDLDQKRLIRIFENGSRSFNHRTTWSSDLDDQNLIIHLGGVGMTLFDPQAALEWMNP